MSNEQHYKLREKLNHVSSCFCLAKWFQVTIHLQNGQTHSCHHPFTHQVGHRELEEDPSTLHNTTWKKYQRFRMLNGIRPKECEYCWKIEDAHPDNLSDRTLKSGEDWALPFFQEAIEKPWDYNHNPRYVEVSFGHACNFKCMYCAPHISSSIMGEFLEHGHYKEAPQFSLDYLNKTGQLPIPKDDYNPYVDAFWRWWPDLVKDLIHFRITGGEPLVNQNTFRFLDYVVQNPLKQLNFSINSNLGIPDKQLDKFLSQMKIILEGNLINSFTFYTSVDTYGTHAEYIRNGLDYKKYMNNVRRFLTELPQDTKLIFMCTYNALSVVNFRKFLEEVVELKKKFMMPDGYSSRVILDMPYLKDPQYLSLPILTKDFWPTIKADLEFMREYGDVNRGGAFFSEHEISKMERIYNYVLSLDENDPSRNLNRTKFRSFQKEYDRRKGTNFLSIFPEMAAFHSYVQTLPEPASEHP